MNTNDPTGALVSGNRQIKTARSLPSTGGIGWAENPYETDDIELNRQIDYETDIAVESYEHYRDLIKRCADDVGYSSGWYDAVIAYRKLLSQPLSLKENKRLWQEVFDGLDAMMDAFEGVARVRVGECVERGESYVYEVEK